MRAQLPQPHETTYREFCPSPRLQPYVECYWTHFAAEPLPCHRVLPDGCADILLSRPTVGPSRLLVVGTMTNAQLFDLPQGLSLGVRFRPGMLSCFCGVPGSELLDRRLSLDEIGVLGSNDFGARLLETAAIEDCLALIEQRLNSLLDARTNRQPGLTPAHRALQRAEQAHGCVTVASLAHGADLSTRHFRRACLELTGLTPKQLCRALRFRYAAGLALTARSSDWSGLAAHFINDFRSLSGLTPTEYSASI
jgi:AraC-like DNA-binding protein